MSEQKIDVNDYEKIKEEYKTFLIKEKDLEEQLNKFKGDNFLELEDTIGVNQYDLVIFGDLKEIGGTPSNHQKS